MGARDEVIYAGCSGYSFREWVGPFYPPKTKPKDFLSVYARSLTSVEINHTFRRFPRIELVEGWAEATPDTFKFSFKMHQSVTHTSRLRGVERSVNDFMDALAPLGRRLGVVLFQLPPFFKYDSDRLDRFLQGLPAGHRFAIEFRNASWYEPAVFDRLSRAGVAVCAGELELEDAKPPPSTAPFGYLRLRKAPPYSETEVEAARALVETMASGVKDLYVYVKHDEDGRAPSDVSRIAQP